MQVIRHRIDTQWVPVGTQSGTAASLYVGQLVRTVDSAGGIWVDGVFPMSAAVGAADTTGKQVPFGIVEATNDFVKQYNSTLSCDTIIGVTAQATQKARDFRGVEGPFSKNDPRPFVQVALIGPQTVIRAPIYTTSFGTAPTAYTPSAANGTQGLGFTTSAVPQTPVAMNSTWYCRKGANAGLQRVAYSTSTTAHTFYIYFPFTVATTDSYVWVQLKDIGTCEAQFDANCMFINNGAALGTDYFVIEVLKLDISKAGYEYVDFKFNADHFCLKRA